MKIVLVSKCSLDIEQYVEFKMSVLISPSKSLISSRWVTFTIGHLLMCLIIFRYIFLTFWAQISSLAQLSAGLRLAIQSVLMYTTHTCCTVTDVRLFSSL